MVEREILGELAESYSPLYGFIYIFNAIVGTGLLFLPKAFSQAGLVLGTLLLIILAGMNYMTATFMVEAMFIANAYSRYESRRKVLMSHTTDSLASQEGTSGECEQMKLADSETEKSTHKTMTHREEEQIPLMSLSTEINESEGSDSHLSHDIVLSDIDYEITLKFEMGTMVNLFYHPIGIVLYYVIICLNVSGSRAVALVTITKSLVSLVCTTPPGESDTALNINVTDEATPTSIPGQFVPSSICFEDITQQQTYYIILTITIVLLCPWTYFKLTRSKYLQLATTIMRNIGFGLMIGIAIAKLAMGNRADPFPPLATLSGFPVIFGVGSYAFTCQTYLPGIITPMKTKRGIYWMILINFGLILSLYLLVSYTAVFLFPGRDIFDVYVLNFFKPFSQADPAGHQVLTVIGYYLALFPVFTLGSSFPISAITMRENLKDLARILLKCWIGDKPFPVLVDRLLFPTLAILPPVIISFSTTNIILLVSVSGAYLEIWLHYLIPATLVFSGKYAITKKLKSEYRNKYKSPFSHISLLVSAIIWTIISLLLIIADDILRILNHTFLN